ncbi:hypothetical protein B7486_09365 [cyanobacterium TDX16]|nr:hypothetical protein B7486_09365 [cyanobacterium TDX16]
MSVASIACIVVLGGSAWFTLKQWTKDLPTFLLVRMAESPTDEASNELLRRLSSGSIDGDLVSRVIGLTLPEITLELRSPFPAKASQIARLAHATRLPINEWKTTAEQLAIFVDGSPVEKLTWVQDSGVGTSVGGLAALKVPALAEGLHEIEVKGDVVVSRRNEAGGAEVFRRPFALSQQFKAEKRLRDYVSVKSGHLQSQRIGQGLAAVLETRRVSSDSKYQLQIFELGVDEQIVASVWIRSDKKGPFTRVGDFVTESNARRRVSKPHFFLFGSLNGLEENGRVEVKLVPDTALALKRKKKEFFGGTVQWSSLKLFKQENGSGSRAIRPSPPSKVGKVKIKA